MLLYDREWSKYANNAIIFFLTYKLPPYFPVRKKRHFTDIALISGKIVRIQKAIPFFWLTFHKESAKLGYFTIKWILQKSAFLYRRQNPGKTEIFQKQNS